MLTCTPASIWKWNYNVEGSPSGPAEVTFHTMSEQGTITLGGVEMQVVKQGWLSGQWTLERSGETYATAVKPSALFRSFDLSCGETRLVLKARSPFTTAFEILSGEMPVGSIRRAGLFTRSFTVDCRDSVPELAQLFAFWLVALMWRRASKNKGS